MIYDYFEPSYGTLAPISIPSFPRSYSPLGKPGIPEGYGCYGGVFKTLSRINHRQV